MQWELCSAAVIELLARNPYRTEDPTNAVCYLLNTFSLKITLIPHQGEYVEGIAVFDFQRELCPFKLCAVSSLYLLPLALAVNENNLIKPADNSSLESPNSVCVLNYGLNSCPRWDPCATACKFMMTCFLENIPVSDRDNFGSNAQYLSILYQT